MDLSNLKITAADYDGKDIESLPDTIAGDADNVKKRFDAMSKELIVPRFNNLIDRIEEKITLFDSNDDGEIDRAEVAKHAEEADTAKTITAGEENPINNPVYLKGALNVSNWINAYQRLNFKDAEGSANEAAIIETGGNIYFDRYGSGNIHFRTTSATVGRLIIHNDGKIQAPGVYSNTASGSANVTVDNNGYIRRVSSLKSSKTNIEDVTEEEAIKAYQLRPRSFYGLQKGVDDYRMYGFVAEEVNKVLPDLATKDEKGNLIGVAYDRVCALLLKQNQLLLDRVQKLEKIAAEITNK